MAKWDAEKDSSDYTNVSTAVGISDLTVTESGNEIKIRYRAYIRTTTTSYSQNQFTLWVEGTRYNVKASSTHSTGTWYSGYETKTITLSTSSTTTLGVGVAGKNWNNSSALGTLYFNVTELPNIVKPTVSGITVGTVTDTSIAASFSVTDNGGEETTNRIYISVNSSMSPELQTVSGTSANFEGLIPNKYYYIKASAKNAAGTKYANAVGRATSYTNPGAPTARVLTFSTEDPIPQANYIASWTAPSNSGSEDIAGYRVRLYKNNIPFDYIDTESTSTSFSFNGTTHGFAVGDVIKVGLYSYTKDWDGNKHFNGNGAAASQVFTNQITIVSDKFIWISVNGGEFVKRKAYLSENGSSTFKEIKKAKVRIIT